MKKNLKYAAVFALFIGFTVLAFGCATSDPGSATQEQQDQLDIAVRETSDYLNRNIKAGNKLAILNIQSDYPVLSEYVIDELIANAVNDRIFSVVDRQQLDTIRAELDFHMSGEVDDASAQELGRMLGAQTIISGGITKIGNMYRLRVRALGVQNAQIEGQFNKNIPGGYTIDMLVQSSGTQTASAPAASSRQAQVTSNTTITTTETAPTPAPAASTPAAPVTSSAPAVSTPAAPVTPPAPAYRIGDTGPAGGIIFYDKGNNSGGWRYLEAAPVEAEFQAPWTVRGTEVENTQATIGSGKRNTQLIIEKLRQTSGEWDTAAQQADDLVINNFDDWFLPSQTELDQMYGNLKRRNLGDFKNGWYWSSTDSIYGMAYAQNFQSGEIRNVSKRIDTSIQSRYVRPIRQVPGP